MCIDHLRVSHRVDLIHFHILLCFAFFSLDFWRSGVFYIWHCSFTSGGILRLNTDNMGSRWGLLPLYLYPRCGGKVEWNDKWPKNDSCLGVLCFRLPVQAPSTRRKLQILYVEIGMVRIMIEFRPIEKTQWNVFMMGWSDRCWQCELL